MSAITTNTLNLSIELKNFWHIGTGKGSGNHLDALVEKDANGLPVIPGRMIKGLLRDVVHRLEGWKHFSDNEGENKGAIVTELFGSAGFISEGVPRNNTIGGCLRFGNATLSPQLSRWLVQEGQQSLRQEMYQDLYSTAIDEKSGVAKQYSLRGIQVTIPMTLQTCIVEIKTTDLPWRDIITRALPLVRAVGASRSRGLGRTIWNAQGDQS